MASKFRFNFDLSSMQRKAQLKRDFEEFKKTDKGKAALENLSLSPEAAYSEYTNRIKFVTGADSLQSNQNTLKSNAVKLKTQILTDYSSGFGDRPPEEMLGSFAVKPQNVSVGGMNRQAAPAGLPEQAMKRGVFGGSVDTNQMEREAIGQALRSADFKNKFSPEFTKELNQISEFLKDPNYDKESGYRELIKKFPKYRTFIKSFYKGLNEKENDNVLDDWTK